MTDESPEVEYEDTPTRVRVVLVLGMGGKILGGPPSPDATELVLPSHEVRAGQSIAASARAIVADVLDREPGAVVLRGLSLVSPADEEADELELCVATSVDGGAPAAPLVAREPWAFHSQNEVRWSPAAARALAFPAGAFSAVDLDGVVLPLGSLAIAELREPYAGGFPPFPESSSKRETVALGVGITGGVAWASGIIWALALVQFLKPQLALVLWVLLLVGVFALAAHGRPARRVAVGGALALPMGFVLFVLSMWAGGVDEAHVAFWLWVFGLAAAAIAYRLLGAKATESEQHRTRRRVLWAAATLVSLVAVFPPLRDTIFKRGDTSAPDEDAPTPRAPADD